MTRRLSSGLPIRVAWYSLTELPSNADSPSTRNPGDGVRLGRLDDLADEASDRLGFRRALAAKKLSQGSMLILAERRGRIVASLWLEFGSVIQPAFEIALRPDEAWRTIAITVPEHRGKGIFADLHEFACRALAERGYSRSLAVVSRFNRPARRAQRRLASLGPAERRIGSFAVAWTSEFTFVIDPRRAFQVLRGRRLLGCLIVSRGDPLLGVAGGSSSVPGPT